MRVKFRKLEYVVSRSLSWEVALLSPPPSSGDAVFLFSDLKCDHECN